MITEHAPFQSPHPELRRWDFWGISGLIHFSVIVILFLLPGAPPNPPIVREPAHTLLYSPAIITLRLPVPRLRPAIVTSPAPVPVTIAKAPASQGRPTFREPVTLPIPPSTAVSIPEPSIPVAMASARSVLPAPELPTNNARIKTPPAPVSVGTFDSQTRNAAAPAGVQSSVRMGGFANDAGGGGMAGSGTGRGASVIARAGFDQSGGGATKSPASQSVKSGSFDLPSTAGSTGAESTGPKSAARAERAVEILSKPKPVYTAEARSRGVEGEVVLEVLFGARGQVQVMRVVRGLGYGLDESARAAANQIHFRPGERDGTPVDKVGTVHIVFQLS